MKNVLAPLVIAALLAMPFSFLTFPFVASVASAQVTTVLFNRDLSVGSTGSDVLLLQQILNKDSRTEVSATGVGSPGNETSYFGGLTKQAVINFQNIYAADVLTPAGLTSGTGYVGQYTRNKLNALVASGYLNGTGSGATSLSSSGSAINANSSANVTVIGSSVAPTNATSNDITNYSAFTSNGVAQDAVSNYFTVINGLASGVASSTYLSAAATPSPVTISSISPSSISLSSAGIITLTGTGFSSGKNYIYSEAGYVVVSNSNGTQLSFTLSSLSSIVNFQAATAGESSYTLNIYVGNQFGQSNKIPLTVLLPAVANTSGISSAAISNANSSNSASSNSANLIGGLAIAGVAVAIGVTLGLTSTAVKAVAVHSFDGKVLLSTVCTCNPTTTHIQYAAPFNNPAPLTIGALDYSPLVSVPASPSGIVGGPATYANFKPTGPPGIYDLGDYVPTVQACYMYTPDSNGGHCELAGTGAWSWMTFSSGLINRVGSSLLPQTPAGAAGGAAGAGASLATGAGTSAATGLGTDANGNPIFTTNNSKIDTDGTRQPTVDPNGTGVTYDDTGRDSDANNGYDTSYRYPAGSENSYNTPVGPGTTLSKGTVLTSDYTYADGTVVSAGDPLPASVTTTSANYSIAANTPLPAGVSLDANTVPFVVVPFTTDPNTGKATPSIPLGTQVTVTNNVTGAQYPAIVGDAGPGYNEVSLALANQLGTHSAGTGDSANSLNITITYHK